MEGNVLRAKRAEAILGSGQRMTRGKLCVSAVRKSGRRCYNLQYRRKTKHFSKAIPVDQLAAFERSTEVCREFLKYVQRFVDEQTKLAIREIAKEAKDARRKAKAAERAHR